MNQKVELKGVRLMIIFLLSTINLISQSSYSLIDEASKMLPDSLIEFPEVADYLTKDLTTTEEKVRAIYIWITHNIAYDLDQSATEKEYASTAEIVEGVMKDRKGVCMHYANLFLAMSESIGIQSYMISGYTRENNGTIASESHAWNAVKIDTNYYLLDLTWAAGYVYKHKYVHEFRDAYFLIPPKEFIETHMPFDPIWQFLNTPIDNADFKSANYSKLRRTGTYQFPDSIRAYEKMTKLQQVEAANNRLVKSGINNDLIKEQVENNYYNIGVYQFNEANEMHTFGVNNYNEYIKYRNKRFRKPKVSDALIRELINNAELGMKKAYQLFTALNNSNNELKKKGINDKLRDILSSMQVDLSNLEKEVDYVNRYLKTWKPLRIFVMPKL